MKRRQGDKVIRGEVLPAVVTDVPTWYVDGENLPADGAAEREAAGPETALVPVRSLTVEEMLEAFSQWMRLDVGNGEASEHTLRAYFGDVRQHLEWLAARGLLGPKTREPDEDDLKLWKADLVGRYAITTATRKVSSLRVFYRMAYSRGMISQNPAEGLKPPKDKTKPEDKIQYFTYEEIDRIFGAIDVNKPRGLRDRAILALMYVHSLRSVAIHRLRLEDVHMDENPSFLWVNSKGNKWRKLFLTEKSVRVIDIWLKVRNLMRTDSEYVFVSMHWANKRSEPGQQISTRGIWAIVNKYVRAAGAKREGQCCHMLRHSFAMHALDRGVHLLDISTSMGHSSITTTQIYAKRMRKERMNPALVLDEILE